MDAEEQVRGARDVAEFCRAIRPQLIGSLTLLTGDRHLAEELAQETLVRVWDRWDGIATSPAAYAHRTAVNAAMSWRRRLAARHRAEVRLRGGSSDEDDRTDHAAALAVRAAVAALPMRQRTALVLRYYADLPVGEVARVMGCPTGTVKSLTSRAIAALRAGDLGDLEEATGHA